METLRYALIGREDIRFGTGQFEVTLADGRKVMLNEVNVADLINPLTENIDGDTFGLYDLGFVSIGNSRLGTTAPLDVLQDGSHTNTVKLMLLLAGTTSGSPAAGIGSSIRLQSESADESPSDILELQGVFTDVNSGSEDSDFRVLLRTAGAALAEKLRLSSTGILVLGTIGTPNGSGLLEMNSTTQGFLPPRMTTTQRDAISSPAEGLVVYNTTTDRLNAYDGSSWLEVAVTTSVVGVDEISGLALSNNGSDATNDIDIALGVAASDDAAYADRVRISLTSALTKQLDATWAQGTNQGGRFSGVSLSNTTYHVFLIRNDTTGTVDAGFDTSVTGANVPAGWSKKRRIGSILRESAAIVLFTQTGDLFMRTTPVLDVSDNDPTTGAQTRTLSVPLGVKVWALLNMTITSNAAQAWTYVSAFEQADDAPSSTLAPLYSGPTLNGANNYGAQVGAHTNTSAQIRTRTATSDATVTLYMATLGWRDRRERG